MRRQIQIILQKLTKQGAGNDRGATWAHYDAFEENCSFDSDDDLLPVHKTALEFLHTRHGKGRGEHQELLHDEGYPQGLTWVVIADLMELGNVRVDPNDSGNYMLTSD